MTALEMFIRSYLMNMKSWGRLVFEKKIPNIRSLNFSTMNKTRAFGSHTSQKDELFDFMIDFDKLDQGISNYLTPPLRVDLAGLQGGGEIARMDRRQFGVPFLTYF